MSEVVETFLKAKESFERGAEIGRQRDRTARYVAVLIGALGGATTLIGVGIKHIEDRAALQRVSASDSWVQYQNKSLRASLARMEAELLETQPNSADPALAARIRNARQSVERYTSDPKDGLDAIAHRADNIGRELEALDRTAKGLGGTAAALQLAIVVASGGAATHAWWLAVGGGILGSIACCYAVWIYAIA
jgi:hypothetical protein